MASSFPFKKRETSLLQDGRSESEAAQTAAAPQYTQYTAARSRAVAAYNTDESTTYIQAVWTEVT